MAGADALAAAARGSKLPISEPGCGSCVSAREKLTTGEVPFRKAYLGSDDGEIRILGRKDVLDQAVLANGGPCQGFAVLFANGAPERIRTPNPQIRSLMLYPVELRARTAATGRSL
jgi:hypothetical protein